ncbi:MAG: RnfABCDGE type electron transport complex subunit C [Bergeyella sp.]|nr:RnfABCDGE type electron transport complex subunit C [Bergeyella sp.]
MLLIPSKKKKTRHCAVETIRDPRDFYLPLDAYRGTLEPIVELGQKIRKYQCVAHLEGTFATRLHAPVSGRIKAFVLIDGKQYIHLENDFKDLEMAVSSLDTTKLTVEGFSEILAQLGIEGSGGSRFPTQMKYRVKEGRIETLIFNGVECEPYLSADTVLMKEKGEELLRAAQLVQSVLKARRVIFVIEKQNSDVRIILDNEAKKLGIPVEFCMVSNTYPQGGELQVIRSVTGLELKKGEIPGLYGILLNNVGTLWAIYRGIFEGKPYTERVLTISGNQSTGQGNYWVKIGTPVSHLLNEAQNKFDVEGCLVVLGGAMMGKAVFSLSTGVNKGSGGLLLLKKQKKAALNCIKCGACVDVCPQRLMPLEFVRHVENKSVGLLRAFYLQNCIECGACAYVCPSHVPLMENIFKGKNMLSS